MIKKLGYILAALLISVMCVIPLSAYGANGNPSLQSISFKNARLDTEFNGEKLEYTVTLQDNTVSPTLESYKLSGDAQLFIDYISDDANHQTGITATVSFEKGGGVTYAFKYSNPPEYNINGDNSLSDIYCEYGELDKPLTDESTSYILYVPDDLKQVTIVPTPRNINAFCQKLDVTLNDERTIPVSLNCYASNGESRTYKIKIKRVNKTVEQVKEEMKSPDYKSFVEGTRFYENQDFYVVFISGICGIIALLLIIKVIRRTALSLYDKDEKPFYSSIE